MSLPALLAFAVAMFILAATPGPGVFATVARSLASGMKPAARVAAGIVVGDLLFLFLALFGLSAISETLHGLFLVVKYAGAAYLVYLGVALWRKKSGAVEIREDETLQDGSNFLSGLAITLGNPKVIIFYVGFLPTFIDLRALTAADIAAVALIVALVLGTTLLAYALAASRARELFRDARSRKMLDRSAASVMVATGVVLAAKS